jgi:hypothetical protein
MPILDFFKKRPDGPADYWVALAHERFQPDDLLKQAQEAERAGFDGSSAPTTSRPGGRGRPRRRAPETPGSGSAPSRTRRRARRSARR